MDDKMTRREALRGMFLAGMGLAFCGPLLCDSARAAGRPGAPAGLPGPWKEAPEGTKIDTRTWSKMGETLGMLGLGCMRLPTLGGKPDTKDLYKSISIDKIVPMAGNIQLVFYRKPGSDDILVKFLLNENETSIPIKTDCAPYYHWSDVKRFWEGHPAITQ